MRPWLALCACLWLGTAVADDQRLIDQYGRAVSTADLNAHWLLVYFGYSTCPEVCPAALTTVAAVLDLLGPQGAALMPVFVSLEPGRDTPERLKVYAAHFSPRLLALTGTPAAVADAAHAFDAQWQPRTSASGLDHGRLLYLVAPGGSVAEVFHAQQQAATIAERIRARMRPVAAQ